MRRLFTFLLLAAALLSLAACGSSKTDAEAPADPGAVVTSDPAGAPVVTPAPPEETEPPKVTDSPADGEMPENAEKADSNDLMEIAKAFIGRDVSELIDAIGEPISSDYAPGCLGSGEDGELKYDGFSVYTYRENGVEEVRVVK